MNDQEDSGSEGAAMAPSARELKHKHVDTWLDRPCDSTPNGDCTGEAYAKFVIIHMRMPAWMIYAFRPYMKDFPLYCTYNGMRKRVAFASRMGTIRLVPVMTDIDGVLPSGIEVYPEDCKDWSDKPEVV